MSSRTRAAVVCAVVVLTGCQNAPPNNIAEPDGSASSPPGVVAPLLAFRAAGEIGVIDGTQVVGRAGGAFVPTGEPLTTEDGRFVFARSGNGKLVVLDAETMQSRTTTAPVGPRIGTGGASTVVWIDEPNRLMELDLSVPDPAPTLRTIVDLPPSAGQDRAPMLVAAQGDVAVVARVESDPSPYGGPDTLYAVRRVGDTTRLGAVDANTPVSLAAFSPDGNRFAFAQYTRSSNTCGKAALTIVSLDGGTPHTIQIGNRGEDQASRVLYLWWPPDAFTPSLSYGGWNCAEPQAMSLPRAWSIGSGDVLNQMVDGSALKVLQLTTNDQAILMPDMTAPLEPPGNLIIDIGGAKSGTRGAVNGIEILSGS